MKKLPFSCCSLLLERSTSPHPLTLITPIISSFASSIDTCIQHHYRMKGISKLVAITWLALLCIAPMIFAEEAANTPKALRESKQDAELAAATPKHAHAFRRATGVPPKSSSGGGSDISDSDSSDSDSKDSDSSDSDSKDSDSSDSDSSDSDSSDSDSKDSDSSDSDSSDSDSKDSASKDSDRSSSSSKH